MKRMKLPSPAMVVAVSALVIALAGTAYAAKKISGSLIKANTVTGKQIKESTVKNVTSARTLNGERPNDLKVRWFLLNEQGVIEDQSGGFTVLDAYDTNTNAYIDAGSSLEGKGLSATVAIQNQIDTNPAMMGVQGSRNGEAAITRCQIPGVVDCAPANSKTVNALAVTASLPNGDPAATASAGTGPGTSTKRIYVEITP